jgi:FixG-like putative oxidoreductase
LFMRSEIEISVSPERNPRHVTLSDGSIRNAYEVRLRNRHGENRNFLLSVTSDDPLRIDLEGTSQLIVTAPADSTYSQRLYLTSAPDSPLSKSKTTGVRLWVEDLTNGDRAYVDTIYHGAGQ